LTLVGAAPPVSLHGVGPIIVRPHLPHRFGAPSTETLLYSFTGSANGDGLNPGSG